MSLGTGHWKLTYNTGSSTLFLKDVNSILEKSVKYDYIENKTIDGVKHNVRAWKYITYKIIINGFTASEWENKYQEIDGKTVEFWEHEETSRGYTCFVESVMPFYEDGQYDKLKLKLTISTVNPTIETVITPTGSNTQNLPVLDHSLGYADWLIYIDGDDYEPSGSWNLTDYEFNKPDQVITKSVLTGKRWLTRKGTYNKHKITIKEPNAALTTALLNNVGQDVQFTPFTNNIAFSETMILKDVKYYNPDNYYLKNSIEFKLESKEYSSITM